MDRLGHSQFRSIAHSFWTANTRFGTFGSPLGLVLAQDGGELRFRRLTATTSEVTVPYPAWAARPDSALCLPTALALADETSTFAGFALWDHHRHRPGVSISLSGQLVGHGLRLPRVEPGEQLTFLTKRLRSGRTLGHAEIEVWRGGGGVAASSELLLSGRHSKLMASPMRGLRFLEAVLGHPRVYPLTQLVLTSHFARKPVAPFAPTKSAPPTPALASARLWLWPPA